MGGTLLNVFGGRDEDPALLSSSSGSNLSYEALRRLVFQTANSLKASGIRPGDVVTIADTNTVEYIVAFLGVTLAQAVAAPVNSNYTTEEFHFYLEDASSKLLLVPAKGNAKAQQAAEQLRVPIATLSLSAEGSGKVSLASKTPGFNIKQAGNQSKLSTSPQPDDVALLLHTSGTTSKPKAVPLSHGNLAASLQTISGTYELSSKDRSLLVMPLFHVHGLMAGLLAPLAAGAAVILPATGGFSASHFWRDATSFKATFYTAVPTMHQILLARADKDYPGPDKAPLRFIRSCSSALAAATLHKLENTFHAPVLEAYAMTEASHQMTSNPLPSRGPHKPGTVGTGQGSVKVAILDGNNQPLPPQKIGEICVRGPNVTRGYLNNPKANEEAFAGNWLHTGDQGFVDEEGYVTLTGRIKELINRGGEKISPIEVDGALLSHPNVAEAVSFAAPDEKYGESVAAAVVPSKQVDDEAAFIEDVKKHAASKLAKFKVPTQVFVTDKLPKTATGKIQRRHMVTAFIKEGGKASSGSKSSAGSATDNTGSGSQQARYTGYNVIVKQLAALGVRHMFGVIGIPVTELASAAQAEGIRFFSFRNEQAAGYAAASAGYLTGRPGVLLTVSGPGAVHGAAGCAHAHANCWPLLLIAGSAEQGEIGKGSFQELDQVEALRPFCKLAVQAASTQDIGPALQKAYQAALAGRPGATYVDIPSNVLMAPAEPSNPEVQVPTDAFANRASADSGAVQRAASLLRGAQRPLLVVGKGAAYSQADSALRELVDQSGIPFLSTAMGRGVVPDSHAACVQAARSLALAKADVAVIVGARLNWQLHFGESPKWANGIKFILVDVEPDERDSKLAAVVLRGDAAAVTGQLHGALRSHGRLDSRGSVQEWKRNLSSKVEAAKVKLTKRLDHNAFPLDYETTLRVIRDSLLAVEPHPIIVAEGANTMDNARVILEPVEEGRLRLDAGTWGTMGIGLGGAIAAAATSPERLVVAVEGDSAFGFSGMECETIARYQLPIVVLVFNNGGIYGGDRRPDSLRQAASQGAKAAGFGLDPIPTDFVRKARYDQVMEAFGGDGYNITSAASLATACRIAFRLQRPALINIHLDPLAGLESGNVHAFNAPKSKM
ncbi:hypothetical protein WJX73_009699 [Symbiochloris irregularis]|uniref:2-hydroxyacyl-CoA lyase n=1 Tax=Symbiochloris irregularis TaxID=706552 RepID=A0AAW1PC02_9CHLO